MLLVPDGRVICKWWFVKNGYMKIDVFFCLQATRESNGNLEDDYTPLLLNENQNVNDSWALQGHYAASRYAA